MEKYRFKTEKEFREDNLWDDISRAPDYWAGKMSKNVGQNIPEFYNQFCDIGKGFTWDSYYYRDCDYVLINNVPPKYRFKTEQEFREEGHWREGAPSGWVMSMLFQLGQAVPSVFNNACDKQTDFLIDGCLYRHCDYVLISTKSSSHKFKKGDFVFISEESSYRSQGYNNGNRLKGEIIALLEKKNTKSFCYKVQWSNDHINSYREIDLIPYFEEKTDLLALARERYPIGTKFSPAHVNHDDSYSIVSTENYNKDSTGNIMAMSLKDRVYGSIDPSFNEGNNSYMRILYYAKDKKWAKIIPKEIIDDSIYLMRDIRPSPIPFPVATPIVDYDSMFKSAIVFEEQTLPKYEKPKLLIEPVHSVNINIRTKNKKHKF